MPEPQRLARAVFEDVFRGFPQEGFERFPGEERLARARAALGVPGQDAIYAFVDTSIRKDGGAGLAITESGVFWHNFFGAASPEHGIPWEQLAGGALSPEGKTLRWGEFAFDASRAGCSADVAYELVGALAHAVAARKGERLPATNFHAFRVTDLGAETTTYSRASFTITTTLYSYYQTIYKGLVFTDITLRHFRGYEFNMVTRRAFLLAAKRMLDGARSFGACFRRRFPRLSPDVADCLENDTFTWLGLWYLVGECVGARRRELLPYAVELVVVPCQEYLKRVYEMDMERFMPGCAVLGARLATAPAAPYQAAFCQTLPELIYGDVGESARHSLKILRKCGIGETSFASMLEGYLRAIRKAAEAALAARLPEAANPG